MEKCLPRSFWESRRRQLAVFHSRSKVIIRIMAVKRSVIGEARRGEERARANSREPTW